MFELWTIITTFFFQSIEFQMSISHISKENLMKKYSRIQQKQIYTFGFQFEVNRTFNISIDRIYVMA